MKPSTWRRLATAIWRRPNDPTIHGAMDLDATNAQSYLEAVRAATGVKVTITHLVARAAARAVANYPQTNVRIRWGRVRARETIDVCIQVVLEGGQDLSSALIQEADTKSLDTIGAELRKKAEAIRSRKDPQFKKTFSVARNTPQFLLRPLLAVADRVTQDFGWHLPSLGMPRDPFGSVMVTSVGMLGIDLGFPPIFPLGRAPILLCVGRITDRPWVVDGEVTVRPVLTISCAIDHRLLDGYQCGQLANFLRDYLEDPAAYDPLPEVDPTSVEP